MTEKKIKPDQRDRAFMYMSLPCNPTPFLNRMLELVKEHGVGIIKEAEFESNLYVIIMQAFNQPFTLDMFELFSELNMYYKNNAGPIAENTS